MKRTAVLILRELRRLRLSTNRKTSVFVICLLLASGFWLLNALTKTYMINVAVPLKYHSLPEDRIVINALPPLLSITIEGDGFSLIGLNEKEDFDTQYVNIRSGKWIDDTGRASGFISTQAIKETITRDYSGQIKVLDVAIDSIYIATDQLEKKELPVQARLHNQVPEGKVFVDLPKVSPSSVLVFGPAEVLKNLNEIALDSIQLKDKSGAQYFNLPLRLPHPLLNSEQKKIELEFQLEELTEATINVPIHVVQNVDSIEVSIFPTSTEVKCKVGLTRFDQLSSADFKAIVKASEVKNRPARLNVYVESLNKRVDFQTNSPQRVDYIIRKL